MFCLRLQRWDRPFPVCLRHISTVFAFRCEYAMKSDQVYPGLRHQRRQFGDEILRLKDDVRGAIAVRRFELISDILRRRQ